MNRIRVFYCKSFETEKKRRARALSRSLTHYSQGQFQEIIGKILVKHFAIESAHQPHRRKSKSKEFRESNTYFFFFWPSFFVAIDIRSENTAPKRAREKPTEKKQKKINNSIAKERKTRTNASKAWAVDNVTIASLLRSE